jgi:hypothetical protein
MIGPYIISGESAAGQRVSQARAETGAAVSEANLMLKQGIKKVRIIDSEGRIYSAPDFGQLITHQLVAGATGDDPTKDGSPA